MAYALLLDRLMAERAVVATLVAAGADVEMPSIAHLDAMLGVDPGEPEEPQMRELRAAVGLS